MRGAVWRQNYNRMKRKLVEAPVLDRNCISELHASIHERLLVLDRLNEQYKSKQEEHFVHSFMNVVEKMGNDLILAQEAYRNIDIEVKRDQYCMELAAELQFFRTSCFQLKTALQKSEKSLLELRIEKENDDTEMASIRLNLEKKIKENMALRAENKQMARKVRQLINNTNERQCLSTDARKFQAFKEEQRTPAPNDLANNRRMLVSQGATRRASPRSKAADEPLTDSHSPHSEFLNSYQTSNSANPASFRRRFQKSVARGTSGLFK